MFDASFANYEYYSQSERENGNQCEACCVGGTAIKYFGRSLINALIELAVLSSRVVASQGGCQGRIYKTNNLLKF